MDKCKAETDKGTELRCYGLVVIRPYCMEDSGIVYCVDDKEMDFVKFCPYCGKDPEWI